MRFIALFISSLLCSLDLTAADKTATGQMAQIVADVLNQLSGTAGIRGSMAFDIPDLVLDAYVQQLIGSGSRKGLLEARLRLPADGIVEAGGAVDLERLRAWEPQLFRKHASLQNLNQLKMEGRFQVIGKDGSLQLKVVSLKAVGIGSELARTILDAIARHQPERFDISKPIALPFRLKSLSINTGVLHAETSRE